MKALHRRIGCLLLGWTLLLPAAASAQWQVMNGGNAQKNGRVDTVGPVSATERWRAPLESTFGMPVFVDGGIVVTTRLVPSPPGNIAADLEGVIVGLRLDTGQVLWTRTLPVDDPQTDWTGRALAMRDGRVYASRSGFGATKTALYALDAATGATLWRAFRLTAPRAFSDLSFGEGLAFLGNGDLLVGNSRDTPRLRASDGATISEFFRSTGSISGGMEPLIVGDGNPLYLRGGAFGGRLANWDLASGTLRYQSPDVGGEQTPLFANDSQSLYVPGAAALHAFKDTGTTFNEKWSYPNGSPNTPVSTHAVGPDGSVYTYAARADGVVVVRLDPDSGLELAASSPIRTGNQAVQHHMAVDRNRTLYVSNGEGGRLFAFRPDLSLLWQQDIGFSAGGPALASDGTLLIATPSGLVAYNTDPVFGSGFEP